jgi:hypothetical protein
MAQLPSINEFVLTEHARKEMTRRQISEFEVREVLKSPGQTELIRPGLAVYQAKLEVGESPKTYLLRVFVNTIMQPSHVITVYRTSKIEKYWRTEA